MNQVKINIFTGVLAIYNFIIRKAVWYRHHDAGKILYSYVKYLWSRSSYSEVSATYTDFHSHVSVNISVAFTPALVKLTQIMSFTVIHKVQLVLGIFIEAC